MDFLDPQKQRAHMIRLIVGYVLIGVLIIIATTILLYQAFGYGLDRKGEVIQNGLVFVSSQPQGARIYLNTKLEKDQTNTKLQIPGGSYNLELQREGYHSWQRQIAIEGGSVEHFDYPLLFPTQPKSTNIKTYTAAPSLATQSPDRKWLLVAQPNSTTSFDLYDVNDPEQVATRATTVSLPPALVANMPGQTVKVTEWSNNNRHVVLEYTFEDTVRYILVDREEPAASVDLTNQLQLTPGTVLSLKDKKFDQYYLFDAGAKTLASTTLEPDSNIKTEVSGLLAFKSYGSDKILYATETGASTGKVMTMLKEGDVIYKIQEHPAAGPYMLDLVRYDGNWVVAVGASGEGKVFVYRNPQSFRKANTQKPLTPASILKVGAPNFMAFSSNSQNLMLQNGTAFAVYDADTDKTYNFTAADPLDAPATHATWMDGHRIVYPSGGKLIVLDYDNLNRRSFAAMNPAFVPFFDRDYNYLYTVQPGAAGTAQTNLTSTTMLTAEDL